MIAANHLNDTLGMLGQDAPRLAKALRIKGVELRHLLEHWDKAEQGGGAWKGYRQQHGPYATPTQVNFDAIDGLRIGANPLSIVELVADLRRVENELIEIETRT